MQQRPWYLSTIAIIIAFLIFWPVGIVLIFLRAKGSSMDKQAVFKGASNQKLYVIGGAILVLIGISNLFNKYSSKGWAVFMIVGGLFLVYYSTRIAKTAARNRDYINMIVNQDIDDVTIIADACGVTVEKAEKEIQQLISIGVLKNTTLDTMSHTVMIQRPQVQYAQDHSDGYDMGGGDMVAVVCPGCGAKMTLRRGTSTTCDYCDAPIVAR